MKTTFFFLVFGLFFISCQNTGTPKAEEPKEETPAEIKSADLVIEWQKAFLAGDSAKLAASLADNFQFTGPTPEPMDKSAYIGLMKTMKTAFPDMNNNIVITEDHGVHVAGNLQMQGTHTGNFDLREMGMKVIPPTNKAFKLPVEKFSVTLVDGKVTKFEVDVPPGGGVKGILTQLGIEMPKPK